ncbi:hypothetical protein HJD18_05875 [Thermoleophilia bacterium SCSIO 60948]|nr:hypothetical protein HJD18_05875 [Thermoleophilia bacterium SCSIO 60948]
MLNRFATVVLAAVLSFLVPAATQAETARQSKGPIAFLDYVGKRGQEQILLSPERGPVQTLFDPPGDPLLEEPEFSPNGRLVTFGIYTRGQTRIRGVWVMRSDGTHRRRIGPGYSPTFMPDGKRILFAGRRSICKMRLDGSGRRCFAQPSGPASDYDPAISDDGRRIVFSRGGVYERLMTMRSDGTAVRRLTRNGSGASDPDISPDGKLIAYGSYSVGDGIQVVRPDGTGRRELEPRRCAEGLSNSDPSFSPNGRRIVFTSGRDRPAGPRRCRRLPITPKRLYTMRIDGSERIRLHRHPAHDPNWGRSVR